MNKKEWTRESHISLLAYLSGGGGIGAAWMGPSKRVCMPTPHIAVTAFTHFVDSCNSSVNCVAIRSEAPRAVASFRSWSPCADYDCFTLGLKPEQRTSRFNQ